MSVGAPAPPRREDSTSSPVAVAPRRGAFAAALALARTRGLAGSAEPCASGAASPGPGPLTLVRRRCDADEGQRKLSDRRSEAEVGEGGSAEQRAASLQAMGADLRPADGAAGIALLPAPVLERIVLEAARMGGRPFVDMTFGRDLRVHLTQSTAGVELLLTPHPRMHGRAVVELPALVAALRARGVLVARAEVRLPEGASARPGALTPCRTSATTAATSHPGGTVAKW